jgi:hypothetical protein
MLVHVRIQSSIIRMYGMVWCGENRFTLMFLIPAMGVLFVLTYYLQYWCTWRHHYYTDISVRRRADNWFVYYTSSSFTLRYI